MSNDKKIIKDRATRTEKNKNKKQWYKDKTNCYDVESEGCILSTSNYSNRKTRMQVNYNLKNDILNVADFDRICKPFGDLGDLGEGGELPVEMVNRDIISPKIKALQGMAMKRPFSYKILATNTEATTRRELEEVNRIREFVTSQIMSPIRQEIELQYQEELAGEELSEERREQILKEIQEEEQRQTPEEVKKYMAREHQDPSEILFNQLLNIHKESLNLKVKFDKALEHGLCSAVEVMYIGVINKKLKAWNVNPLDFNYDDNPDLENVKDGEWANCVYRMSPSKVIELFGDNLTTAEIDEIYESVGTTNESGMEDLDFRFGTTEEEQYNHNRDTNSTVRVLHTVFTSLRKIGFLTSLDEEGNEVETLVDESYSLQLDAGDVKIDWKWLPEKYETWRINSDIYPVMQPLPGQYEDLNNIGSFPLPYIGVIYDNTNSIPTSLIDRLKNYQYNYNVVLYRLDNLLASDEGKKVMMSINALPDSAKMSMKEWNYYRKASPFIWFDPNEEGSTYHDMNSIAKHIDLSVMSDISKYIEIAEYIRQQAGKSVGITDNVEGQTSAREAVANNQQNLIQTSNILEPYFNLHEQFKKAAVQQVLDCCKIVYRDEPEKTLSYVLDDMSIEMLKLDSALINNTTIGLYVSDSGKISEVKDLITQLSHAAMQNQAIEMSTVVEMYEQEDLAQTKEIFKKGEREAEEKQQRVQEQQQQAEAELEKTRQEALQKNHENEKELIILKEEERRKTEIVKNGLMGASFNPDQDVDNDGTNDFLEIARDGLHAEIERKKIDIEKEKLQIKKQENKDKFKIEKAKLNSKG